MNSFTGLTLLICVFHRFGLARVSSLISGRIACPSGYSSSRWPHILLYPHGNQIPSTTRNKQKSKEVKVTMLHDCLTLELAGAVNGSAGTVQGNHIFIIYFTFLNYCNYWIHAHPSTFWSDGSFKVSKKLSTFSFRGPRVIAVPEKPPTMRTCNFRTGF